MYPKRFELKLCDETKLLTIIQHYYGHGSQIDTNKDIWLYESKLSHNQTTIPWFEFVMFHLPRKMIITGILFTMNEMNEAMLFEGPSETINILYKIYLEEIKKNEKVSKR